MASEIDKKPTGFWTGDTNEFSLLGTLKNRDEQENAFKEVCSALAPALKTSLDKATNLELTLELTGMELRMASETLGMINPEETLVTLIQEEKFSLEGLFGYSKSLFSFIYNLMLGGQRGYDQPGKLTDLEKIFNEKLKKSLSDALFLPLKEKIKTQFKMGKFIDDIQEYQKIKWSFETYHLTFSVKQESELGTVTIVVPSDILKAVVLSPAGSDTEESNAESDTDWMYGVIAAISAKEIPLNARLGILNMSLKNVLNLQGNDVYPVIVAEGGHTVFLNNKPSYLSTIGTVNGLRAVQIIDSFQGENNG